MSKKEEMYAMLAEYRASGMSQNEFCLSRQISLHVLKYWTRKERAEKGSAHPLKMRFVPLQVQEPLASSLEIVFPNGVKVRGFGSDTDLVMRVAQRWETGLGC